MKVNKTDAVIYLLLFGFCMPRTISVINPILSVLKLIGLVYALMNFIKYSWKRKYLYPIYVWLICMIAATVINHTDFQRCITMVYPIFCCVILTDKLIRRQGLKALKSLSILFMLEIAAQAFTGATKIMGHYSAAFYNYFFGLRVEFNNILIFAIAISLIAAILMKGSEKWIAAVTIICGVYFIVMEWLSTAIMTCVLFVAVLVIARFFKSPKFWRCVAIVAAAGCIYFVTSGVDTSSFSWLLNDILGEGLTLNGRTMLWSSAMSQIKGAHWLYGNGYGHSYWFTLYGVDKATSAHSQYVNILFNFGLIGFGIYCYLIVKQIKAFMTTKERDVRNIILGVIISTLFMGISTSTYSTVFMYIWLVVCMNLPDLTSGEEYVL